MTEPFYLSKSDRLLQIPGIHYLILLVVCFFAFFVNNQVIPADLMEARNLATAQEMVREGNYLVPTLNGELRLEKPPLPTWIAAALEQVWPGDLSIQRYAAGLVATLLVIFLYLMSGRLTGNRNLGLICALILATCFNIVLMGRTATWDIYCHSFMMAAIYFMVTAFRQTGPQWKNFLGAGFFMGLSFLGKGPVSFYSLLLPFLMSYGWVYRPSLKQKGYSLAGMIAVCLLVSCWWMVYLYIFHPEMALSVAAKESSSWINHNVRPIYYYWQFPAEVGIWALFFITAILSYFSFKTLTYRKEYRFSLLWLLTALILLSLIPEKKTRYLLPILIPGSLVMGFYFYHLFKNHLASRDQWIFRINALVIALVLASIPMALYLIFYREEQISLFLLVLSGIISWSLCFWILRSIWNPKGIRVVSVFLAVIAAMIMVETICLIPFGKLFINEERHSIRALRDHKAVEGLPLYYHAAEELRMELVYESNKTIRPLHIDQDTLVLDRTPFVFVSGISVDSLFAGKNVTIEHIDTFDNNWRKTGHKRYNPNLVRHVAIIRKHPELSDSPVFPQP